MKRNDYCREPNLPCDATTAIACWSVDCPYQKENSGKIFPSEKDKSRPRGGHPRFYEILNELADLHDRKNHDYAGDDPLSNLKMCELAGIPAWQGVVIRLTDKISRLLTFIRKKELKIQDESIEDTFKDAAIYAVLGLVLYRESKYDG